MLATIRVYAFLLIAFLLTSCAKPQELPKPLPKGNRIAVITNFRDQALFQRAGTIAADNVSFYRSIPKLKINSFLTTLVANDLHKSRRFRVIPIYHHPENDLMSIDVSKNGHVRSQLKAYLSRLIKGKRIDTIVFITPGSIDFGNGQYFGSIWWASGYGLFNRAFMFIETNTIFSAYQVYVIDANTYKILAHSKGSFQKRLHGLHIAWGKGYAGVSKKALPKMRSMLRKEMPSRLKSAVHQVGLS